MENLSARVYTFRSPLRSVPAALAVCDSRPTMRDVSRLVAQQVKTLRLNPQAPFPSQMKEAFAEFKARHEEKRKVTR